MKLVERLLLALFPRRFRRRFDHDLRASLRGALAEADRAHPGIRRLGSKAVVVLDFVATAIAEHLAGGAGGDPGRGWIEGAWRDLGLALRQLRRAPGFTITVVATLALAVGANTAVFSVLYSVLLEPLPYARPEQLVYLWGTALDASTSQTWSEAPGPLARVTLISSDTVVLSGDGPAASLPVVRSDASLLEVLGIRASEGRWFSDAERRSEEPVVVLRTDEAVRLFGSETDAVGRSVRLDGREHTVIGTLSLAAAASLRYTRTVAFMPLSPSPRRYSIVARLDEGVSVSAARTILAELPLVRDAGRSRFVPALQMESLHELVAGSHRQILSMLYAGVALVLLLACLNVAHLFLVRTGRRMRELAIRTSLGARRSRLVRQLLVEGLVAAALGTAGGLLVAPVTIHALLALAPGQLRRGTEIGIDLPVLGYSILVTAVAGCSFVLLPALVLRRCDLHPGRVSGAAFGGRRRLRGVLMIVQVAVTVTVLGAAGMLTHALVRVSPTAPGFDSRSKLTFDLQLPPDRYPDARSRRLFFERLLDDLEALPAVRDAEAVTDLPLSGSTMILPLFIDGQPVEAPPTVHTRIATAGYLRLLDVRIVRGAQPGPASPDRIWINEHAASVLFPGVDALGQRVGIELDDGVQTFRVAGIVDDMRMRGTQLRTWPELFLPFEASPSSRMSVLVATDGPPEAVARDAAGVMERLDPLIPVDDMTTLESILRESVAVPRFNAAVMASFAALTLLLSCVGVFGNVAHGVNAARRELGIRLALGADGRAVARLVYSRTFARIAIGAALGLAGVCVGTRWAEALLFGLSPTDPWALSGAVAAMVLAGSCAAALPTRRAARIDPTLSMRVE